MPLDPTILLSPPLPLAAVNGLIALGVVIIAPAIGVTALEAAVDWLDRRAGREPAIDHIDDVEGREVAR